MKRIVAALLVLLLVVSLTACGKQQATQEQPKQRDRVVEALRDQIGFFNAFNDTKYSLHSLVSWSVLDDRWNAEGYVIDLNTDEKKSFKTSGGRGDSGGLTYNVANLKIES